MIRFFLSFFLAGTNAFAIPEDFPPTAFQLVQVRQFAQLHGRIDKAVSNVCARNDGIMLFETSAFSTGRFTEKLVPQVEGFLRISIPSPLEATKDDWRKCVREAVSYIKKNTELHYCFRYSFMEEGLEDIIVDAVMLEQASMRVGKAVLWRCSQSQPEMDRAREGFQSFSLGLFSGFINDGFIHHNLFDRSLTACTYSYISSFLYQRRILKTGVSGLYTRMRELLPDFFAATDGLPKTVSSLQELNSVLDQADEYYLERDGAERVPNFWIFPPEKRTFWNPNYPAIQLYGVSLPYASLEALRLDARSDQEGNDPLQSHSGRKRGDFLKPHHAIYGQGEMFHPKVPFPQEGVLTTIFEAPGSQTST